MAFRVAGRGLTRVAAPMTRVFAPAAPLQQILVSSLRHGGLAAALPRGFCSHSDFAPQSHVKGTKDDEVQQKLKKLVEDNKVVLFMKGSPDMPQCGFSRAVAQVLEAESYQDYSYVDVLKYPEVREGVKIFSDWPTVPQLYVDGEFVGGCDIVVQMHRDGELKEVLDKVK
mmetsp:Transcript_93747/g.235391  ORF Transcript_93747/g.235391 Transcript_93747/m.235391 type:complete len:170 (+) Transcript_93747:105-614(+)